MVGDQRDPGLGNALQQLLWASYRMYPQQGRPSDDATLLLLRWSDHTQTAAAG